jgi:hypothetical protein
MKNRAQTHRRPWFLWIGGACFLVGSILFSAIGFASSAGPPNQTVTANQGTAGSSSWPVGISGSLPAGTNDIGTVHVAAPTHVIGQVNCQVPDGPSRGCDPQITGTDLATGTIVNTLSVSCGTLQGSQIQVNFEENGAFGFSVPLTFTGKDPLNPIDMYTGTLTNLGIPIQSDTENFMNVSENYDASSGNGADCDMIWTGTTP